MRETEDKKKTVVVFGLKEEYTPQWTEREKKEKTCVEKLVGTLQEEKELTGEIKEIKRGETGHHGNR